MTSGPNQPHTTLGRDGLNWLNNTEFIDFFSDNNNNIEFGDDAVADIDRNFAYNRVNQDLAELAYDKLLTINQIQNNHNCVEVDYFGGLNSIKNPRNTNRIWEYQTCTEWGFYQTCNVGTNCPYTQGLHTIDYDYYRCMQAFNVTKQEIKDQVQG